MSSKKETRPGAATPERASKEVSLSKRNTLFMGDDTTETKQRQVGRVYECLPVGKENAIPGRDLANLLGIRELRNLTAIIERERRGGLPICASTDATGAGYYIAATPEELEEYISSLNRRVRNTSRTMAYLEDTLAEWIGQERIEGL